MASPFHLSGKRKEKSGSAEYNKLLQQNMKRYKDRDDAVRKTNIATGHGNSTAQRFMHEKPAGKAAAPARSGGGGGGGGAGKTDRRKTSSTKKRGNFSLPTSAPTPTPRSASSPDLAVSPPRPRDPMAQSAPTNNPPVSFSPDLAVSPQFPPDPMRQSAPTGQAPGYVPPPNASMFQGSTLQTLPPALQGSPFPSDLGVSPQFPPDPMRQSAPQPGSLAIRNNPPVVGSGGPVGAGNPLVGAQPGPNPLVGSGGASGAGSPLIDPAMIRRLLGFG